MSTHERRSGSSRPRDPQRSETTGSTSTTPDGASVTTVGPTALAAPEIIFQAASSTPAITLSRARQELGKDASPHFTSEKTGGEMNHGTPGTSAKHASCGSGAGHLRRLTSGCCCTIQDQKGQQPSTSDGSRAAHGQAGAADGTVPTRATGGTTVRAGDRIPFPRTSVHVSQMTKGDTMIPFRQRHFPSSGASVAHGASDANDSPYERPRLGASVAKHPLWRI